MKPITQQDFLLVGKAEVKPEVKKAQAIINEFIDGEWEIVEVEESDFDNLFKFDNPKQGLRAATLLRNAAKRWPSINIAVKQRDGRIFVGMRSKMENNINW